MKPIDIRYYLVTLLVGERAVFVSNKVSANLNMFSLLLKDRIAGNLYGTEIITITSGRFPVGGIVMQSTSEYARSSRREAAENNGDRERVPRRYRKICSRAT